MRTNVFYSCPAAVYHSQQCDGEFSYDRDKFCRNFATLEDAKKWAAFYDAKVHEDVPEDPENPTADWYSRDWLVRSIWACYEQVQDESSPSTEVPDSALKSWDKNLGKCWEPEDAHGLTWDEVDALPISGEDVIIWGMRPMVVPAEL